MLVGHEKIIKELKGLAGKKKLSHGYIFFGQPRIGKKLTALCLANFLEGGKFETVGILSDLFLIEPENGSIGIDAVRQIKKFLGSKPVKSAYRAVIVDDAESLTNEAQNALLKITEEPPTSALIILVVSDPEKILPTISSRLQKIYFSGVSSIALEKWIKEEFNLPEKDIKKLAEMSAGQPGLAWLISKDKHFREWMKIAKDFLASQKNDANFTPSSGTAGRVTKEIVDLEDFNFKEFLDILLMEVSWLDKKRNAAAFWHKLTELRRQADFFNLNPRLQLENLLANNS